MIAKSHLEESPAAANDLTARYLAALRQGGSMDAIHTRLAELTSELINARSVVWVAYRAASANTGRPPTEARTFEFNGHAQDQELVRVVTQAEQQSSPVIESSSVLEGATAIGIAVPHSGVLFCRLVARANALSSFVALLRMAAGYFVLAEDRQRFAELQSLATQQQSALTLNQSLWSAQSRQQALANYCQQIRGGWGIPLVMLFQAGSSWRRPRLVAVAGAEKGELGAEIRRLAGNLAWESQAVAAMSGAPATSHSPVRSSSEEAFARHSGYPQVCAIPIHQPDKANSHLEFVLVLAADALGAHTRQSVEQSTSATSAALSRLSRRSRSFQRLQLNQGIRRGLIVAATCGMLAVLAWVQLPYRVRSPVSLEPTQRRHIGAPFDGVFLSSKVASGDLVTAQQTLGELDDTPLRLELSRLNTELIRTRKQLEIHVARGEISDSQLAQLRIEELEATNELLRKRIGEAQIVSPIDGVVISRDLDDVADSSVSLGDTLYQVAPLDVLRAEIEVPDEEASRVTSGQRVSVWIEDGSSQRLDGTVARVAPTTVIRRGNNVLLCEVLIENPSHTMRPGMVGTASIDAGQASVGWILFHRLWERVRVYLGA